MSLKNRNLTLLIAVAVIVILVGVFAYYSNISNKNSEAPLQENVVLTGSGATFPQAQINYWIQKFNEKYPNIKIEYMGGGSGKGQTDFVQGVVDFAGSDVPMKTEIWTAAKNKYGKVYQIPWIAGGEAIVYNVPEISGKALKLSREALAGILLGKIVYWDDPLIAKDNPGVTLPHKEIIFVHRSDASGTTAIFTSYLSLISTEWRQKVGVGLTVSWPLDAVGRGVGAQGNQGVAQTVKNTPYSLGYVEFAYMKGLQVAMLENRAGEFVEATGEGVSKALAGMEVNIDPTADLNQYDLLSKILDVQAKGAYPIVSVSYVLVKDPSQYSSEKAKALGLFLEWVFKEGQSGGNIIEGYAPVSGGFVQEGLKVAEALKSRK